MQAWAVAIVAILLIVLCFLAAYLILKFFFPEKLENIFNLGEEKLSLTKSEARANYHSANPEAGDSRPRELAGRTNLGSHADDSSGDAGRDTSGPNRSSPGGSTTGSEYEPGHSLVRANSAESLASDASVMDLAPDVSPIGQVEIGLEYDRDVSELVVSVIQARDLAGEAGTELDFFAVITVTPDAANMKSQTKVIKRNPNPTFKERFLYTMEPHQLTQKSVNIAMFSIDKYARNKHIGETEIRLGDVDLQRPLRLWLNLREIDQKPSEFGELMFSLSYLPTAERLTVVIVKAKNLRWMRKEQSSGDVLVKVHLILNNKRTAKKKTSVKKQESTPTFNEAMIFNVSQANLSNVQLRFTVSEVRSDNKLNSIGHVIIGSQTGGTELTHWQQMMSSLRKPVAMWHYLRKK